MPSNKERRERSGEVRPENTKHLVLDVINQAREKYERQLVFDDWQAVAKAYGQQRAEVHVHFAMRHIAHGNVAGNYCAAFHRTRFPLDFNAAENSEARSINDSASRQHQLEVGQPMFVYVGEAVNNPEGVACILIPSTVRLQHLDSCLGSWNHAPDFALALLSKLSSAGEDGKRRLVGAFRGQRFAPVGSYGKFIGEIVEGGADVVDAIAEHEGEASRRLLKDLNFNSILGGIRVRFVDKAIWLSFAPPAPFVFHGLQVLPRPV
jgi:hypothetical protein